MNNYIYIYFCIFNIIDAITWYISCLFDLFDEIKFV